jgi:hypothetical protein
LHGLGLEYWISTIKGYFCVYFIFSIHRNISRIVGFRIGTQHRNLDIEQDKLLIELNKRDCPQRKNTGAVHKLHVRCCNK